MKKLAIAMLVMAVGSTAMATGTVRGDSVYLFNSGSTGSPFAGYWALAANDGAAIPSHPITSVTAYNDAALTPSPNIPMAGDVNGDGVSDVVINGKDASGYTINLGRNTATSPIGGGIYQGDLGQPSVGAAGWAPAPDGNWSPFWDTTITHNFIADVNGDGKADAVSVKPTPWDGGASTFFEANHSDAEGLEGHAPANSYAAGILNQHSAWTPIIGDFNGDGAADIAQQRNSDGFINGMVSTLGSGLNSANPTFWGGIGGYAANHVATLVGDINGDGIDDIVQVDDRNSNGSWTWVAGITGANGGIPAGVEIAQGGATSWANPFSLDANSISATPLLADMDNDGRDDLVLYEEYLDTVSGNVWGRLLTSLTDGTGLFGNGYDGGSWYDYVGTFGADGSGMVPVVGNVHVIPEPATLAMLGFGGLMVWIRRKFMI